MGEVVSVIKSILGFAGQTVAEKNREQDRDRQKSAAKLKNPIQPPFFYKTLEARKTAEDTGKLTGSGSPYTISEIRKALIAGILPAGYSIEQLEIVGFGNETKAYDKVINTGNADYRHDLGDLINTLADGLETGDGVPELADLGLTQKDIDKLRDVASRAKLADPSMPDEMIDVGELIATIDKIKTISGEITDVEKSKDTLASLSTAEQKASDDRSDAVLSIAKAAYAGISPKIAK